MRRRFLSTFATQKELLELKSTLMSRREQLEYFEGIADQIKEISVMTQRNSGEIQRLKKIMSHVTAGLGIKFEKFNKSWIEHFLCKQGIIKGLSRIEQGRREYRVGPFDQIEIDLFSLNPAMIAECTSFLDSDEMAKVQNFSKVRALLSERYNVDLKGFIIALAIHERIKPSVQQFCEENNLTLITQFD